MFRVLGSGCPGGGLAPAPLAFAADVDADAGAFAALCCQDVGVAGAAELTDLSRRLGVRLRLEFPKLRVDGRGQPAVRAGRDAL
jgi:hypothetical protein